ncbi:diacylglycerol kinase family protein [Pseudoalteromonas sp. SSM20]|uniref:diacylglycerol kinase family protein n=1 Tax=Pseudoalteromonas sp. SSM20 TaxID=3139394 RepID=UPI003BAA7701
MHVTLIYFLLVSLAAGLVFISQSPIFIFASSWIFLALLIVFSAYLLEKPHLFRKRATGQIPLFFKLLLLPYLLGAQIYNAWQRNKDSVPALQQVEDQMFIACRLFPSDIPMLKSHEIGAILDVTAEFDGLNWSADQEGLYYLNLPVLDHHSPSRKQIRHALRWIEAMHSLNKKVVIHCALGRGRSVFLLCTYLLYKHKLSAHKALDKIKALRQSARLNRSQKKRLNAIAHIDFLAKTQVLPLVINPVSGGGKWYQYDNQVIGFLTQRYLLAFHFTEKNTNVSALTHKLKRKYSSVIACGGDGTVTAVAHALTNSDCHLGFIPLGTANALAHVLLGVQSKFDPITPACEAIVRGKLEQIDTIQCNEHTALLLVAFGFEEQMISFANREEKNHGGQFAYINGFINALSEGKTQKVSLAVDQQAAQEVEVTSIAIANAAPFSTLLAQGGGAPNYQDGKLDLTVLKAGENTSQILSMAQLVFNSLESNTAIAQDTLKHTLCKRVCLQQHGEPVRYSIDGEIKTCETLTVEIKEKSLWIMTK